MSNKKIVVLLCSLFCTTHVFACANMETHEPINTHTDTIMLADGTEYSVLSSKDAPFGKAVTPENKEKFEHSAKNLERLYFKTKNIDYLSDKGLMLMYLGRYTEAEKTFISIEKIKPNRYATASNLGTTYELLGKNKQALELINKAVTISPDSHKHSEWIHINILKAKIKGKQFHTAKFILNVDFGTDEIPKSTLSTKELQTLHDQLLYQLNERVHFVKPKDTIVAELVFALADTAFLLEKYSGALYNYNIAREYGYTNPLLQVRESIALKRAKADYQWKADLKYWGGIALLVGIAGAFFTFILLLISKMLKKLWRLLGEK